MAARAAPDRGAGLGAWAKPAAETKTKATAAIHALFIDLSSFEDAILLSLAGILLRSKRKAPRPRLEWDRGAVLNASI
jgi:hypothetical protein